MGRCRGYQVLDRSGGRPRRRIDDTVTERAVGHSISDEDRDLPGVDETRCQIGSEGALSALIPGSGSIDIEFPGVADMAMTVSIDERLAVQLRLDGLRHCQSQVSDDGRQDVDDAR